VRILLLNDNSEHPNWGAQATPFALGKILEARIPGCEIEALSWDWIRRRLRSPRLAGFRKFQIPLDIIPIGHVVFRKLTMPVEIYPAVRDDFEWFADRWAADEMGPVARRFVVLARRADVVVYNGENNLYRNTLEGCRAVFLTYLAKTRLGKPVCAVNHTIHITSVRPIMKAMVETVFPLLDLVTSREPRSHRAFLKLGVSNARNGADVAFALEDNQEARGKVDDWLGEAGLRPEGYACLSASGLPASAPRDGYDGAVTNLVSRLREALGVPVVLVARDPSCQFLEEVARRTGNPFFGPEHHFMELWPLLRNATVLVTGHYHYAIIGAIGGCPFVPLSVVNHKMTGLCEQLSWYRVDPFDVTWLRPSIPAICEEAAALVKQGSPLRERLKRRAAELRDLAMATGDWVREVVPVRTGGVGIPGAGS